MRRSSANPILTRADIPDVPPRLRDATSVFNPGAVFWNGRHLLLLRVQTRGRESLVMIAEGSDGTHFDVRRELVAIEGLERVPETIHHLYDPRVTVIEGVAYVVFAADLDRDCRLAIARTDDFERFELVSFDTAGDRRNGVLFPERVGGRYLRLERPNRVQPQGGPSTGSKVVLAESDDLVTWRYAGPVFGGRPRRWDELVGSGPPPVKTRAGWLHLYHGIATHFAAANIYQAGAVLLDLDDPLRVLARTRDNLLEPREPYELMGQVPNVVFPSGMVIEGTDDEGFAPPEALVRVYYGAADTTVALATTTVGELLAACES